MDEYQRIKNAIDFHYDHQGYVDIGLLQKMASAPSFVLENVLKQEGFTKSGVNGQWIKEAE